MIVHDNIPLPKQSGRGPKPKYAWPDLRHRQCIVFEGTPLEMARWRGAAFMFYKSRKVKIKTQLLKGKMHLWRV